VEKKRRSSHGFKNRRERERGGLGQSEREEKRD